MRDSHYENKWPTFTKYEQYKPIINAPNQQTSQSKLNPQYVNYQQPNNSKNQAKYELIMDTPKLNQTQLIKQQSLKRQQFINQQEHEWPSWAAVRQSNNINNQDTSTVPSQAGSSCTLQNVNQSTSRANGGNQIENVTVQRKRRNWHFQQSDKVPSPQILGRSSILYYRYYTNENKGLTYFFPSWSNQYPTYRKIKAMTEQIKEFVYKESRQFYKNRKIPVYIVKSQISLPILQKYIKQGTFDKKARFRGLDHQYVLGNPQQSKWYHLC